MSLYLVTRNVPIVSLTSRVCMHWRSMHACKHRRLSALNLGWLVTWDNQVSESAMHASGDFNSYHL